MNRFQGVRSLTREENSSSVTERRRRFRMRYRAGRNNVQPSPYPRWGILTPFPFDYRSKATARYDDTQH